MNNATKLPQKFTPNQLRCILNFEHCRLDKNIYLNDLKFNEYLNKTIYNILLPENIDEMKRKVKTESIFYEAFYFMFLFGSRIIPNDIYYPYSFISDYLHFNGLFDHYYILDMFYDLY
jgi:hypothetical protein